MKRISLVSLLSALIILLGSLTMLGWAFHLTALINILPNQYNLVFNAALCFVIAGTALLLADTGIITRPTAYLTGGSLIALLSGLTIIQDLFNYSFGLDQFFMTTWLPNANPHPGRMATSTAFTFCLSAVVFLLFSKSKNYTTAIAIQIAMIGVTFIGLFAVLGYLLNIEFLYSWYRYTRMSIGTSVGFSLLGATLWLTWNNSIYFQYFYKNQEDKKILLTSTIVLIGIASLSALLGFTVATEQHETMLYRLCFVILILIGGILAGTVLLNWMITPVVKKMQEIEGQLHFQARHDALTGLVNRRYFEEQVMLLTETSQRDNDKFAVFFLDLDKFKQINDTLGHDAGDRLLKIVAERLKSSTRRTDIVSRLGGDEFILVLNNIQDTKTAALNAERIISTLLQPITIKGHDLYITTSIGISFFPEDGTNADTLIKIADQALYRAKEMGRNNYQFSTPEVSILIREEMSFEADLKNAINNNELKMLYLPKVNPTYKTVSGFEGLLRWQSTQHGLLMPNKILPIAEESGFIIQLSEWVIKTAGKEIKRWQDEQDKNLNLAINISARHFMHERLIESITDGLELSGFDPSYFMLEINENLIMQDPKRTLDMIRILKRLDIKILIDNFGTGYSSLTYLQDFDIDFVKIDRSIVQTVTTEPKRADLVTAMISLAKNLGIKVIAEGVETREQYEYLFERGCDELQGYYISKPIAADEIGNFLRQRQTEQII